MTRVRATSGQSIETRPRQWDRGHASDDRDVRWTADRFLWAVVEAPGNPGAGPLAPGLWPQLAEQVHADADTLTVVAAPLEGGRALVCAIETSALSDLPEGTLSLTPERVPECVADAASGSFSHAASRLDFLVGKHLPAVCRSRSRFRHLLAAGGVCGVALLASVGLARRAATWDAAAREAGARASLVAASIDPALTLADLPYLAEEARAQQASITGLGRPQPVAPVLADLLSSWPVSTPPSTLLVEPGSILITVLVEGDPGEFLAALRPPAGYRLQEPRLAALPGGTQVTLVMHRAEPYGGVP